MRPVWLDWLLDYFRGPRFEVFEVLEYGHRPHWSWQLVHRHRKIAQADPSLHFASERAARAHIASYRDDMTNAEVIA